MYYGSFDEKKDNEESKEQQNKIQMGAYATAEMDESVSAIKLVPIKLQPNDYDEEDSTTPMLKKNNKIAPTEEPERDEELQTSPLEPINDKLKELVGNLAADDSVVIDDTDLNADITLLQSAAEGEISDVKKKVEEMKNQGRIVAVEINLCNKDGFTALHMAARYNRKNVVNYLIENEADMNKTGKEGLTPLHLATKYNMTATAKCLIQKGADVNIPTDYGTTVLFFAARRGNVELVMLLLDIPSVDVNKADNSAVTPLHVSMIGGNEDVVTLLLEHGANAYALNKEGEMPIHYAAEENNADLIIKLTKTALKDCEDEQEKAQKQKEFVNIGNNEMDTALHIAAQGGYEETVKTLVQIGASVNARTDSRETPLHLAAVSGQMKVVKFLIMNHAKVNATDSSMQTPLHKSCQFGHLDLCRFLLESGARLNGKDCDNFTPLMLAVWKGQNEVVKFLIDQGADLNVTDTTHLKNLLHLAIEEDEDETLKLLFEKGAKKLINVGDKDYQTPLHYAAKVGNVEALEMLLKMDADIDVTDIEEKNPIHIAAECGEEECVSILGKFAPGSVNYSSETGKSPLHFAAMKGHKATCNALIEMGAEISARDDINWTPLDYAAKYGHSKVIIILLENDAPIDACGKHRATPLHHASANGHTDCIEILLNNDASIELKNIYNKNCLDLAVENGQVDACKALVTHKRWKEVMRTVDNDGFHPMEKLIAIAPSVAELVLDKCINVTKEDYKVGNTVIRVDKVRYDFEFLDIQPDEQVNEIFFAPSNMVKHQRENLLSHRLTVKLISDKWARLGRWIYVLSLFFYLLFLALLTALLVVDKERTSQISPGEKSTFEKAAPWLTLLLSVAQILKELMQLYYLRWHYFKEFNNYLELVLYSTTILFMIPFIAENIDDSINSTTYPWVNIKWQSGAIAILLAWGNLLLYLKRFPFFGLYVVMFTEVFQTLVSVLLVFSIFIIGFALSFYVLMDNDDGFKYVGRSIIKTGVMTLGEFEFNTIFTENFNNSKKLPYQAITYIIFVLFLALMPILIMNFLVGLAVGDIEAVRKSAYLRILRAQVKILKTIESSYPKWLLTRVYRPYTEELVKSKMTFFEKVKRWWEKSDYDSVVEEQEDIGGGERAMRLQLEANSDELYKQKKRLKNVCELLDQQTEMILEVCEKLDIDPEEEHLHM